MKKIYVLLFLSFYILQIRAENIVYPSRAKVLNVKEAPYNAKGDGVTDDADAILKALGDACNKNVTVYMPNGTYLVSKSLDWPWTSGDSQRFMMLQGQSEAGTIIKLKDNCAGFTNASSPKAFMKTSCCLEQAFRNAIRNLTINTGTGNHGAIGLTFFANNQGAAEHVSIISEDGNGFIGLDLGYFDPGQGPQLVNDMYIKGFDYGIFTKAGNVTTLENITMEGQKKYGIKSDNGRNSIRKLTVKNLSVPAVSHTGGFLVLMDCNLSGTNSSVPAIEAMGTLYVRNTETSGYSKAIRRSGGGCKADEPIGKVTDWNYNCNYDTLFDIGSANFNLPILEHPEVAWEQNMDNWANVVDYGADPTGKIDATAAFQAAVNSGKTTIYTPAFSQYRINGTVEITGNVSRIIGCEGWINGVGKFRLSDNGGSPDTVVMERIEGGYDGAINFTIEQASSNRTLVINSMADVTILGNGMGNIFINDYVGRPVFNTLGASIWARQFNIENYKVPVRGSKLWVLGMKSEVMSTYMEVTNGGTAEILGFKAYHSNNQNFAGPMFINNESNLQVLAGVHVNYMGTNYASWITEIKDGVTRNLKNTAIRNGGMYYKGGTAEPKFSIIFTSPVYDSKFLVPANITLEAVASDPNGTISKVDFYYGSTMIGSDTDSPYSFVWTDVPEGFYSLTAKATNNSGKVVSSSIVTIVVNISDGTDRLVALRGPTRIQPGQKILVPVDYEVGGSRDVIVDLWTPDWGKVVVSNMTSITAGLGTAYVEIDVPSDIAPGGGYEYYSYISPTGAGWLETSPAREQHNVTVIEAHQSLQLPGKIEAEFYNSMSGIQTEDCTDSGAGVNVGYIEAGDWMDYTVNVTVTGVYTINYRVASESTGGQLKLMEGTETLHSVDVPVTGGWQKWKTVSAEASLTAGVHTFRIYASKEGWNINWFEGIDKSTSSIILKVDDILVYPNPTSGMLYINSEKEIESIIVTELTGLTLMVSKSSDKSLDLSSLTTGVYLLKISTTDNSVAIRKVVSK